MNGLKAMMKIRIERREPARHALRVLDRVELRDDLADGALEERDQHVGDHHRHGHGDVVAAAVAEDRLQRVGDRGLAEGADSDRRHRDADLAGGDVVADLVERGPAP